MRILVNMVMTNNQCQNWITISLLTWSLQSWFCHRHRGRGQQIWCRCPPARFCPSVLVPPLTSPTHQAVGAPHIVIFISVTINAMIWCYIWWNNSCCPYMWAPLPDPCYNIAAFIQNISFIVIFQKTIKNPLGIFLKDPAKRQKTIICFVDPYKVLC